MATVLEIDSVNGVTIDGVSNIGVGEIMFKTPTGEVNKLDGTPVVNPTNFATTTDISVLSSKATAFFNSAATLTPATVANTSIANTPDVGTVILKSYLTGKITPDPIVTGSATIQVNNFSIYTITNYDATATYNITSTVGTVVNNNDGTFTVTADNSVVNDVKDIVVTSSLIGKLPSKAVITTVTIIA